MDHPNVLIHEQYRAASRPAADPMSHMSLAERSAALEKLFPLNPHVTQSHYGHQTSNPNEHSLQPPRPSLHDMHIGERLPGSNPCDQICRIYSHRNPAGTFESPEEKMSNPIENSLQPPRPSVHDISIGKQLEVSKPYSQLHGIYSPSNAARNLESHREKMSSGEDVPPYQGLPGPPILGSFEDTFCEGKPDGPHWPADGTKLDDEVKKGLVITLSRLQHSYNLCRDIFGALNTLSDTKQRREILEHNMLVYAKMIEEIGPHGHGDPTWDFKDEDAVRQELAKLKSDLSEKTLQMVTKSCLQGEDARQMIAKERRRVEREAFERKQYANKENSKVRTENRPRPTKPSLDDNRVDGDCKHGDSSHENGYPRQNLSSFWHEVERAPRVHNVVPRKRVGYPHPASMTSWEDPREILGVHVMKELNSETVNLKIDAETLSDETWVDPDEPLIDWKVIEDVMDDVAVEEWVII